MFLAASATRCGKKHAVNEDAHVLLPLRGLFAVADGMGGHADGAVASATVKDALTAMGHAFPTVTPAQLKDCLETANRAIWQRGQSRQQITASTVAAVLVTADRYTAFWAGDSRLYHLRDGLLRQVSHDHSEVQDLVDNGVLTAEKARSWPRRNVVTRALGARETVDLATADGALEPGDSLLLCSDGLTTLLEPAELAELTGSLKPQRACYTLVDLARERGERDDITAVIVHVSGRSGTSPAAGATA